MRKSIRNILVMSALVQCVLCMSAIASPDGKMFAIIEYLHPDATVSFGMGSASGIKEGDQFFVYKGFIVIAEIEATSVGEFVTRAKIINATDIIKIGYEVRKKGVEEDSEEPPAATEIPVPEDNEAAVVNESQAEKADEKGMDAEDKEIVEEARPDRTHYDSVEQYEETVATKDQPEELKKELAKEKSKGVEIREIKDKKTGLEVMHVTPLELYREGATSVNAGSVDASKTASASNVEAKDIRPTTEVPQVSHVYPGKEKKEASAFAAEGGGPQERQVTEFSEPVHIQAGEVRKADLADEGEPLPFEESIPGGGDVPVGGVNIDKESLEIVKSRKFKMELSGFRYFKYRAYTSSGNSGSFMSRNGLLTYGNKFEQGTSLSVTGKYGDNFEVNGQLDEQFRQERSIDFSMKAGLFNARFGDFSSEFRSGSLVTLNKKISGVQVQYDSTKVKADYVVSNSKSTPKTITFYGDNTHGPYSLKAFQVLENSERVTINGTSLSPDEYTMDYYSGQITFCPDLRGDNINCREIKTTDQVQIVFEERLLFSEKGGNISAMSAQYQVTDNIDIGVSNVVQEAARGTQRVRNAATFTVTGAELYLPINCSLSTICLPKTYNAQYAMMVKHFEKITKNGELYTDFSISDEGYAYGEIFINGSFSSSDTFHVEYSYYTNDFINEVVKESEDAILRSENGDTPIFYLNNGIYSGTEQVFYCELNDNSIGDCDNERQLIRGVDYRINEDNAIVEILNANYYPNDNLNRYLRIAYLYVPRNTGRESLFDHTVSQVYGGTSIGPVNLKFEYAWSEGDVSKTPIQILKSRVGIANKSYSCPTSATLISGCGFQLNHTNIVELSESISVSDREKVLRSGTDYNIDYDVGIITFTNNFQFSTGTTIIANYQYLPDIQEGIVSGNATIIDASTTLGKFNIAARTSGADTFFAPVEGNNTLETSRLDWSVNGELFKGFNAAVGKTTFERAGDIAETSVVNTEQNNIGFEYTHSKGHSITYQKTEETSQDNLRIRDVDAERSGQQISLGIKEPFVKNLQLDFNFGDESVEDRTGNLDNTDSSNRGMTVSYGVDKVLDLIFQLEKNDLANNGVSGTFSSRNLSKNLLLAYYPTDNIQVETDIKSQVLTGSRGAGGLGKNESTISVTASEMGKIRSAVLSHTNNSIPGYNSGGTNSSSSILTLDYAFSNNLTLKPSLNMTNTDGDQFSSSNFRKGIKFDYRPDGEKYAGSLTMEQGTTHSTSSSQSSSGSQFRLLGDAIYKLNEKTNFLYRLDRNSDAQSGTTNVTLQNSLSANYTPSETKKFTLQFSLTNRNSGTMSTTDTAAVLKSDIKLSKTFKWVTELKNMKYESSQGKDSNYSGTLMESEIRAEF